MTSARRHGPTWWGCAAGVLLSIAAVLAAQTAEPRVRIVSPPANEFVSGPTELRVEISAPERVSLVTFYVQNRQVCVLARPPFACNWDFGPAVESQAIRVTVDLTDDTRISDNRRTLGLDPFADSVTVDAIEVTVTVSDGDNKPVGRLSRDRFRVYEDGREQRIVNFAAEQIPLELVVAVDISGSMAPYINQLRTAVRQFVRAVPIGDPVWTLAFNDRITTLARGATQPVERERGLDLLAAFGATALYDTIVRGTDTLATQGGRKAFVVFTDGEDAGSRVTLDDVERRLIGSDVTLYMIGQGRGLTHENLQRLMEQLVKPTGGRAFSTSDIEELEETFTELLEELSNQYLLTYQTTNSNRDTAWRSIRVDVDGYNNVRARPGYPVGPLR